MIQSTPTASVPGNAAMLRCEITWGFEEWMSQAGGSLVITTYQAGKVVLVGWDGRQVTVLPRDFPKPMGLAHEGPRLALATREDVTLLANAPDLAFDFLDREQERGRYDALYLPRATYHTAELNVHDVAFGSEGLWLVATRFCCLANLSDTYSFVPRWRPPFVTDVVPEDRCHLNGLAMADGRPAFVTCLGTTDVVGGWRETRVDGGVVLHVQTSEIVVKGLSMPHSPRLHGGHLWVLNSGAGELLRVDPMSGRRQVVCSLPGYLRGLCFAGRYALVGLGMIREQHLFGGLPVQSRFPQLRCGVAVVDLDAGRMGGFFEFTSGCTELYDVGFLPGILRPMILNSGDGRVRQAATAPGLSYWLRPSSVRPDVAGLRDDVAPAKAHEP